MNQSKHCINCKTTENVIFAINKSLSYQIGRFITFPARKIYDICEKGLISFKRRTELKIVFKKEAKPLVSIIIPTYNKWQYTYNCLESIFRHTNNVSYEVIVADNASDENGSLVTKNVKNITILRNRENLGFLKNCNNAAKHARGKYIHLLNNDILVGPHWLETLVEHLETNPETGMVGSKLLFPDGRLQEAGGIIWNNGSGCNYGRGDDPMLPQYNYQKEVDYITGASILIRKYVWDKLGGFDERYAPAYYEDADLAFEVRKLGYKVKYQPTSVVIHFEGVTHGTDITRGIKQYQLINKEKFVNKWKTTLQEEHCAADENIFQARDRSIRQKTVLVVDRFFPTFDQDAGSRQIFQYVDLLQEIGFNVKFLSDDFLKREPYTTILENKGIECLYGDYYKNNWQKWIKSNAHSLDVVCLHRWDISEKYIDFIKENTKAKIIYNPIDFSYIRNHRRFQITKDEQDLALYEIDKEKEYQLFEKADGVFTVSEFEKQLFKSEFPSKKIFRVPIFYYPMCPMGNNIPFDERKDIIFVGGFLHQPNADGIHWFINNIYPRIVKKLPDMIFHIIGSHMPDDIKKLNSRNIQIHGHVTDKKLDEFYSRSRCAVAPLRYGAGVKGKVIEAIAYGLPIITTSVGAEGIIDINDAITISDNEEEFAAQTILLNTDKKIWENIRKKEIAYARKFLSKTAALEKNKNIFESINIVENSRE